VNALSPANRVRVITLLLALVQSAACGRPSTREPQVTEGLLPINGTELFVKRMGAGEPIVVVHGGPLLEHSYLVPYLAPLADSYELILYDQRLSGRSASTVDSASVRLATFVDDIEAIRQALDLGPIHLMSHSWGGLLAMHYALEHGDNLRSLILLDPVAASSELWQAEQRQLAERITDEDRRARAAIRESEAFNARRPEAIRELLLLAFRPLFHDTARFASLDLYVPEDYAPRSALFGAMGPDLVSWDLHEGLARLTVPMLILYGADEPAVTLGGAALRERVPHAEFVLVEDAGHFPFIEQQDAFLGAVRAFLQVFRQRRTLQSR